MSGSGCSPAFERCLHAAMFGDECPVSPAGTSREFQCKLDSLMFDEDAVAVPSIGTVREPSISSVREASSLSVREASSPLSVQEASSPLSVREASSPSVREACTVSLPKPKKARGVSHGVQERVVLWFEVRSTVDDAKEELESLPSTLSRRIVFDVSLNAVSAVRNAFRIIDEVCNLYAYVGIATSPCYRFFKKGKHKLMSSMVPHYPNWSRMFLVYVDSPGWAAKVEQEIINKFDEQFSHRLYTPAQRYLTNRTSGGENTRQQAEHMFVYVLTDC